jgi:organic hydroperoxide reductase OsmC/OhrA
VEGVFDRVDGVTHFKTFASLVAPTGSAAETARRLLDKARRVCLISNSVRGELTLPAEVVIAG